MTKTDKKNAETPITYSDEIERALIGLYSPLLDAPLPDTHTGPDPEYHNISFNINFQSIIAAVIKRCDGAQEFLSRKENERDNRLETDPDQKDIRTLYANEAYAKAETAFSAALELRYAFSNAYQEMTGKVFDVDEWAASFDSPTPNADLADRKAKAAAAIEAAKKRRAHLM
jgi:hypothetical protein